MEEIKDFFVNETLFIEAQIEEGLQKIRENAYENIEDILDRFRVKAPEKKDIINAKFALKQFLTKLSHPLTTSEYERDFDIRFKRREKKVEDVKMLAFWFKCKTCKEKFYSVNSYKKHLLNLHSLRLNNNTCQFCKKVFVSFITLASHYNRYHLNEKLLKCGCNKFCKGDTKLIMQHLSECELYHKLPITTKVKKLE